MDHESNADTVTPAVALTSLQGLGVLAGVTVVIAGFIAIETAVGISQLYAGFLFALYWAGIERGDFKKFLPTLLGGLVGIAMSYILNAASVRWGASGALITLPMMLLGVYVLIMNWAPLIINYPAMLYLTIGTSGLLQQQEDFGRMAISVVIGAAYFGGLFYVLGWLKTRSEQRKAASVAR